ncbi:MAG: tryptophan--tRNA ligase, partial [bacterium]|nr:tryptophan--tRNA ligase [bacterium]
TPSNSPSQRGGGNENVVFFRQSDIPEHLELAWYFACVTPVGEMERMTQYKDKIAHGESPNVGLFTYPILQAADILVYGPQGTAKKPAIIGVPVGHDQVQHLELSNDIVRRFNKRFDAALATVKPVLTPTARVMSLKDPSHKMSKSLGGDHCIFLDDSPKEIERKMKAAVTETAAGSAEMAPGVRTLFEIFEAFGSKTEVTKFRKTYEAGTLKYSELKPAVAHAVSSAFSGFRKRKAELLADPKHIDAALAAGAEAARVAASTTLINVRRAVGIR